MLKHIVQALLLGILALAIGAADDRPVRPAAEENGVEVYFSPDGGAEQAVVREIRAAQKTLDMQAYFFTNTSIVEAVAGAHERKVKVRVILDKSQQTARFTGATYLFDHHVPVFIDEQHKEAHNKIVLIDGKTIITGSFNFTRAADTENAENLLVLRNHPKLQAAYAKNFEAHLAHSQPYKRHE